MTDNKNYTDQIPVLCVDDDTAFLKAMEYYLKYEGFSVKTCTNTGDAIKITELMKFDVIVSEHRLPECDALSLLTILDEKRNDARKIIFSENIDDKFIIEALNGGADFYLKKREEPELQLAELSAIIKNLAARRMVEDALRSSEERYRSIFDNANDAIIIHAITIDNRPGRILDANKSAERLLGYSKKELTKLSMPDIIEPEPEVKIKKIAREIFETGRAIFEGKVVDKDKRVVPVEVSSNLAREDGKDISISIIRDTSERRDLLERLQMAVFGGELGTWDWDIPSGKVFLNDRWAEMLGFSPGEVPGEVSSWEERLYPADRETVMEELSKNLEGRTPAYETEHRLLHKDGHPVWVLDKGRVIKRDKEGNPLRMVGTHLDITKRKEAEEDLKRNNEELAAIEEELRQQLDEIVQAENKLRDNEEYIRTVLDNIPIGIAVNSVKPTVDFEYYNQNFLKCYRVNKVDLADQDSFWEAVYEDPNFREEIRKRVLEDSDSGDPERMHWENIPITREGEETTYISAQNIPLDKEGLVISMVWDVTEKKIAEDRIGLHLSRVRSLLDLYENADISKDEIMSRTLESSCSMTESKYAFIGLIPSDESELVIHKWSKGVMKECEVQGLPLHLTLNKAGMWAESVRRRETVVVNDYSLPDKAKKGIPKGHVGIRRFVSTPIFDAGRVVAVLVVGNKESDYHEDDTEALMSLGNLMWEILKNKETEKELRREKELFLRTFESLHDAALVFDAEPESVRAVNWAAVSLFGYSREEMIGQQRVIFHLDEESLESFREHITPYVKENKKVPRFEFRLKKKDGTIFPTEHSVSPLYNSDGSLNGWVSIVRDITEKKAYEKREKAALTQIEKNMEQLATLNDEIRNPLAVITGISESNCPGSFEKIMDQINIIDEMITRLDAGWVRSEKIWEYLRTHYRIGEEEDYPERVIEEREDSNQ